MGTFCLPRIFTLMFKKRGLGVDVKVKLFFFQNVFCCCIFAQLLRKALSAKFAKSDLESEEEHRTVTTPFKLPCPVVLKSQAKRQQLPIAVRC